MFECVLFCQSISEVVGDSYQRERNPWVEHQARAVFLPLVDFSWDADVHAFRVGAANIYGEGGERCRLVVFNAAGREGDLLRYDDYDQLVLVEAGANCPRKVRDVREFDVVVILDWPDLTFHFGGVHFADYRATVVRRTELRDLMVYVVVICLRFPT